MFLAVIVLASGLFHYNTVSALADWWERSDVRPTQPSVERNLPTAVPTQEPTVPPTATPRIGGPTVTQAPIPTSASGSGGSSSSSSDDPCASGKSYTGPYCGWSSQVGGEGGSDGSDDPGQGIRIGGTQIEGLSFTGGNELTFSDIMLLTGVLCLLLYTRSKVSKRIAA